MCVRGRNLPLSRPADTHPLPTHPPPPPSHLHTPSPLALHRALFHASPPAPATITVSVPQMGDSITEGTVATVDKAPGDIVREDDLVATIETDKVTIDVRYTEKEAGVVASVGVAAGDTVGVGAPVAVVESGGVAAEEKKTEPPAAEAAAPAAAAAAPKKAAKPAPPPPKPAPPTSHAPPSPLPATPRRPSAASR